MSSDQQNSANASRRSFLKVGAAGVGGLIVGAAAAYVAKPSSTSTTTQTTTETSTASGSTVTSSLPGTTSTVTTTLPTTVTSTETQTVTSSNSSSASTTTTSSAAPFSGFIWLNSNEQPLVEAIAETIIPTDSNGPGAKEAGVVFFIDRQLASDYGKNANMYMQGPFVPANQTGSITVGANTYSGGSAPARLASGCWYQYSLDLREFWRDGLMALQTYANSAYGGNFQTLSATSQAQVLTDLNNNKPTNFGSIVPQQFFFEVLYMTWAGFFMDPIYGGNQGMVGWLLTGFNGLNMGNFYGEGYTTQQIMVATTPIPLKPASLAQYQQAALQES